MPARGEASIPGLSGLRRALRRRAFLVVLVLWGLLYLPHLGTSPSWYGDETITIACGQDIVRGNFANRGTHNTYANPQFAYGPGYVAVVGAASLATGRDILLPRFLNALLALAAASTMLVVLGPGFGLVASTAFALTFLCYMQSVIHFRWVYAHNAVALGFLVCFAIQSRRFSPGSAWKAGVGLALAATSHPLALQGGMAAGLNWIRRPKAWLPLFLPPLVVGVALLLPIILRYPGWFFEDLGHLRAFYAMYSRDNASGWQWAINVWSFATQDPFHILAATGAVACLFTRLRPLALAALLILLMLTANRQNLTVFYYQAVVVLPLLAITAAALVNGVGRRVFRKHRWRRWLVFVLPAALATQSLPAALTGRLVPRNAYWTTQSIEDLQAAVRFVNQHTTPDDLVLSHWNAGWLLDARTADYLQATAYSGLPTHTFEHLPGHERFRFPIGRSDPKYAIIADIDQRWTFANPNVAEWARSMALERWPLVFSSPTYLVIENPEWKP